MVRKLPCVAIITLVCATILVSALQPVPRVEGETGAKPSASYTSKIEKYNNGKKSSYWTDSKPTRPTEMNRIQISEPYKSLVQTSTRFVLVQSGISKQIDIETAMDLINDTGYMLAKPSVLIAAASSLMVLMVAALTVGFFFPSASSLTEVLRADRLPELSSYARQVDAYLPNGMQTKQVVDILGIKPDEMLAKLGILDGPCRKQSICQLSEMLRGSSSSWATNLSQFLMEYYSRPKYRNNEYVDALYSGLIDQDCEKFTPGYSNQSFEVNCFDFRNFSLPFAFSQSMSSARQQRDQHHQLKKADYQTLVARA